jgi:hypothetical protein
VPAICIGCGTGTERAAAGAIGVPAIAAEPRQSITGLAPIVGFTGPVACGEPVPRCRDSPARLLGARPAPL